MLAIFFRETARPEKPGNPRSQAGDGGSNGRVTRTIGVAQPGIPMDESGEVVGVDDHVEERVGVGILHDRDLVPRGVGTDDDLGDVVVQRNAPAPAADVLERDEPVALVRVGAAQTTCRQLVAGGIARVVVVREQVHELQRPFAIGGCELPELLRVGVQPAAAVAPELGYQRFDLFLGRAS